MRNAVASTLAVMLAPLVVIAVIVGLVAVGGQARADAADPADTVDPGEPSQSWGFVDAPEAVSAGWRGPLTVAWRNASDETRTFDVRVVGSELESGTYDWGTRIVAEPGESFRREPALPALDAAGEYRAELLLDGEVLATADITVRRAVADDAVHTHDVVRVVDVRTSAARIAPESRQRARRSVVTTFGVSHPARVTVQVRDARGHVVARRALGDRQVGRTVRWAWDGRRTSGRVVEPGTYTLHLLARTDGASGTHDVAVRVQR